LLEQAALLGAIIAIAEALDLELIGQKQRQPAFFPPILLPGVAPPYLRARTNYLARFRRSSSKTLSVPRNPARLYRENDSRLGWTLT
jgi:hypothetical protein